MLYARTDAYSIETYIMHVFHIVSFQQPRMLSLLPTLTVVCRGALCLMQESRP